MHAFDYLGLVTGSPRTHILVMEDCIGQDPALERALTAHPGLQHL